MVFATYLLATLTLLSSIVLIMLFVEHLAVKTGRKTDFSEIYIFLRKHALGAAFLVSLTAMLGSLYFSDVLGYEPCKLCWYQRIFMYPQVFLFLVALWRKEKREIWRQSFVLSIIGGVIAGIHYIMQITNTNIIPCSALGYSASCTQTFTLTFGYITIPMMAFTAFLLLIFLGFMRKD